jgi:UDP-glucuronate decarboxylase
MNPRLRQKTGGAAIAGPINLGNPHEFSVAKLAHLRIELTGSRSKVSRASRGRFERRRPDIKAARRLPGWQPVVELRAGLQQTINHFDRLLRAGWHVSTRERATCHAAMTSRRGCGELDARQRRDQD